MSTAREWWGYLDCILLGLCKSQGIGMVGSDTYTWGIKDFHKCRSGSLATRRLCLGPTCVIDFTPLSALSFWVSLFPRMRGYNICCMGQETPHFEETSPIWDYSEALWLKSREGRCLALLEGFCFSMPRPFMLAGNGWQQGNWALRWGGTHPARWKRGPDHPPGRD